MTAPTARRSAPGPPDLLDAWNPRDGFLLLRSGAGLTTSGIAAQRTIAAGAAQPRRAADAAEALLDRGEPGAEPRLAVAALPFDGEVAARVTVPATAVLRRAPGGVRGDVPHVPDAAAWPHDPLPGRHPQPSEAEYRAAVAEAIRRIESGALRKVVLARSLMVRGAGWDPATLVRRLRAGDPDAYTLAARGVDGRLVVGATPELLVRRTGDEVLSEPLAGSAPRRGDPAADRDAGAWLLRSRKDRSEHGPVVEAVADALAPHCRHLEVDAEPHLVATATVWHLATSVRGLLRPDAPGALHLAAALHPTPAVCGTPAAAALQAIRELEPVPRGLYSGIAGWVDGRGDGEWVVTLRCATVGDGWARLHAGAGIVDGSDPDAELAETETKFRALLDALERSASGTASTGRSPDQDTAA